MRIYNFFKILIVFVRVVNVLHVDEVFFQIELEEFSLTQSAKMTYVQNLRENLCIWGICQFNRLGMRNSSNLIWRKILSLKYLALTKGKHDCYSSSILRDYDNITQFRSIKIFPALFPYFSIYIYSTKTIHKPNHPAAPRKEQFYIIKMEKTSGWNWKLETWILNMEMKIPILNIRSFLGCLVINTK